jgi:uncharacterized protein (DUF58 family)
MRTITFAPWAAIIVANIYFAVDKTEAGLAFLILGCFFVIFEVMVIAYSNRKLSFKAKAEMIKELNKIDEEIEAEYKKKKEKELINHFIDDLKPIETRRKRGRPIKKKRGRPKKSFKEVGYSSHKLNDITNYNNSKSDIRNKLMSRLD